MNQNQSFEIIGGYEQITQQSKAAELTNQSTEQGLFFVIRISKKNIFLNFYSCFCPHNP